MDKVCILACLVSAIAASLAHNHDNEDMRRNVRDINVRDVADDSVTVQVTSLLDSIREIRSLRTVNEIRKEVGDINSFVTNKLKETSSLLRDLAAQDATISTRSQAASLVHIIDTLGYLLGLEMQPDESRRLTINTITIYISNFQVTNFGGLYFSQNGGKASISIPYTASFPAHDGGVISVASSVSGIRDAMPMMSNDSLGSDILSTTFLDTSGNQLTLEVSDPFFIQLTVDESEVDGKEPVCTFLQEKDGTRSWSTSGCDTVYPVEGQAGAVHCHCTHLSIFGIIITDKVEIPRIGAAAWVGCSLTILFCVLTALVFIGYRLMSTVRCYIRFSFLTALALAEMLFLCVRYKDGPAICTMVAIGVHFFATASFAWLLSYSLFLGNDLSGDVEASLHVAHYTFIGWAIPFVVVLISFIWRYDTYVQEDYCWISQTAHGLRYAYIIPIGVLIVVTLSVLMYDIGVYVSITDPKQKYSMKVARSGLRSCCCLLPVLASVWILADFVVIEGDLWLQVLLSVLNVILGIMIFLIMFYFNEEVRMKRKHKSFLPKILRNFKTTPGSGKHSTEMSLIWGGFSKDRTQREGDHDESAPGSPASHRSGPMEASTSHSTMMAPPDTPVRSPKKSRLYIAKARYKFFVGSRDDIVADT